jgi:predicted acyl esterase
MPTHSRGIRVAAAVTALPLLLATAACTAPAKADTAMVATDTTSVSHAQNERVPEGAGWTQHYFPSSDGSDVELHADVLLPEGIEEGEQVPVILSVGSYFGHSGEATDEGFDHTGPSGRFNDFIEGTDLFDEGYAFVMVDQRGFGGSSGCQDVAGAGEQADVAAAIDWAATQPWSTGAVGMYGKSFDAITGLIGNNLDQDALKAVIAQEPIWDLYRNIRSNGVPRSTVVDVATSYNRIAALPAMPDDDERYIANSTGGVIADVECAEINLASFEIADPQSDFWQTRDFAAQAAGTDTPLFVTQGFLEWNTEPEAMEEYLTNHEGPQRGWLGQWDHWRGNDVTDDGRLQMGREGWFDEALSFYDQYLTNAEPTVDYPAFAVQDNTGSWREQDSWPVVQSAITIGLSGGSYVDDGAEGDLAVDTGNSYLQHSEPLAQATRIVGTPRVTLDAIGYGNVMAQLYDVAPDGTAVMFDEQVSTLSTGETAFDLKSTDWTLDAGHTLAVRVGTIKAGAFSDWIDTPSNQTIEITGARLDLALDDPANDAPLPGEPAPFMETYLSVSTEQLPAGPPAFTVPTVQG